MCDAKTEENFLSQYMVMAYGLFIRFYFSSEFVLSVRLMYIEMHCMYGKYSHGPFLKGGRAVRGGVIATD